MTRNGWSKGVRVQPAKRSRSGEAQRLYILAGYEEPAVSVLRLGAALELSPFVQGRAHDPRETPPAGSRTTIGHHGGK